MGKASKKAFSPKKLAALTVERNSELEEQIRANKSSTLKHLHLLAQDRTVVASNKVHLIKDAWDNRIKKGTARSVARRDFVQQQVAEAEELHGQLLNEKKFSKKDST